MIINKVKAVFFSPTGTTKKIVEEISNRIGQELGISVHSLDFTLPQKRDKPLSFASDELVVFGVPVIAGRVPNVLLDFLKQIEGGRGPCLPIVLFGNRAYDNALAELRDILLRGKLLPIAAGAFVGEHSFSDILAKGRPDKEDLAKAEVFAGLVADKLTGLGSSRDNSFTQDKDQVKIIQVKGNDYIEQGYYKALDVNKKPMDIRKVKPKTSPACIDCKICANLCPMGSIDYEDVSLVKGICIKCCACIKKCPCKAKYFDNPDYIYHKKDLEENFTRRAEVEIFI